MFKFLTSIRGSADLSIGFDRSRDRRRRELTINKDFKGKYHLRICLRDIFGFAEHQETATCGFDLKLTLTRSTDDAVLNKDNAVNNAKIKNNALECYVKYYTPSLEEYKKIMIKITKTTPIQLHYPETSVLMKKVNTQVFWTFELGVQEGINVSIWIYVVFQQPDRQHGQNLNNDTFYRMPVISAQCIIETEKYPDSAFLLNYNDNDFSQEFAQIKEVFRDLTKDNLLQTYIKVKMILDRLMMVILLVIIYTLSIYDIRKLLKKVKLLK